MFNKAQSQNDPYDDDDNNSLTNALPQFSGIQLPDLGDVDMTALPTLEAATQNQQVSFASELTNRCGISYFSGLVASGIYGAFRGYQLTSKGMPFRLKLNSMLNHSMKLGANNGNMFAVLALYFVTIKRTIPKLTPVDINPDLNLIISGAAAGTLYKAFHPMKTILRFGTVGAAIPTTYVVFKYLEEEGVL